LLPVDAVVADEWGRLLGSAESAGSAIGGSDALIAATATAHGLQVVTRNVRHFRATGVDVISPWHDGTQ
jgi:toxin FitB